MTWSWQGTSRVCDQCDWLVLAEKFYYHCIGCGGTQEKGPNHFMHGLEDK